MARHGTHEGNEVGDTSSDPLILSPEEEEIQPPHLRMHSSPPRIPGYIYDEQHVPPPRQSLYYDSPNYFEIEDYIHDGIQHDRDYMVYLFFLRDCEEYKKNP